MASSGLRKMLFLKFQHLRCMGVGVSCKFFMDAVVNGDHIAIAVVMAIVFLIGWLSHEKLI